MARYTDERQGQIDFFDQYGIDYINNPVLIDNTDGIINGNILEFKLNISDLNKVLFQVIKYLSHLRIKGESVPKTILLIDLNRQKAYQYDSLDYIDDIQKLYVGASSRNVEGFSSQPYKKLFNYGESDVDADNLKKLFKRKTKVEDEYIPIDIDEDCVVGWANRYYRELPNATKGGFLGDSEGSATNVTGEIRKPKQFKSLINPYTKETNAKFKYLMDCLNDRNSKKDLGAFYTPKLYCDKSAQLVLEAVNNIPNGNNYVIIDRCAGTGNLEESLIGLKDKNGEELISHCIVSTYEYYEYKVLSERIGDKVLSIIPPTENKVEFSEGFILNADAMSREYLENEIINQYIKDNKFSIILYENPPYRDTTSNSKGNTSKKKTYVSQEMAKEVSGATLNDLTNHFIWSGFKYYLRQPTDAYILFSPVKYFKYCGLAEKKFIKGFLFNRQHFHASSSAISCILWKNEDDVYSQLSLDAYDIKDGSCCFEKTMIVKKVSEVFSKKLYDKRKFPDDLEDGICCNLDGTERTSNNTIRIKKLYNKNIIGYIRSSSFNFDALSRQLLRCGEYDGNGFFLRKDNYLEKLPLWVAKHVPLDYWYEKDIYATTGDGGTAYTNDASFLKSCLIYTCLSNQNKCLSFKGSDGRFYKNELCFDSKTLASDDLKRMALDDDERNIVNLWKKVIREAKKTDEYDPNITYGVYQIVKDLNIYTETMINGKKIPVYKYVALNSSLETLRVNLKDYYKTHITKKMFKYQLLK